MIKSKLMKKEVLSTNGTHKVCLTINQTLGFKDQCKENTRQQLYELKLGKFVVNNLIAVKLNKKF